MSEGKEYTTVALGCLGQMHHSDRLGPLRYLQHSVPKDTGPAAQQVFFRSVGMDLQTHQGKEEQETKHTGWPRQSDQAVLLMLLGKKCWTVWFISALLYCMCPRRKTRHQQISLTATGLSEEKMLHPAELLHAELLQTHEDWISTEQMYYNFPSNGLYST